MKMRGAFKDLTKEYKTGRWNITFELTEINPQEVQEIQDKDIAIQAEQWRDKRSGRANRMLWACLGEIAEAIHADKWDLYLQKLRECGQYTLIEMPAEALPKFRMLYRECEDIGCRIVDGKEMRQVLCYYGSSTYNSREFSFLLTKVIEDMKAAGLPTPTSQEMARAIEELEEQERRAAEKAKQRQQEVEELAKKLSSVFTDDMDHCFFTGSPVVERHHIFGGPNRKRSEFYGYVIPLRPDLHPNGSQAGPKAKEIDTELKQMAQEYFEANEGTREDFIKEFGKSYL